MPSIHYQTPQRLASKINSLLVIQAKLIESCSELDHSIQNKKRAYLIRRISKHIVWLVKAHDKSNFLIHRHATEFEIDRELLNAKIISRKYTIFNNQ